ncbi:hypothetical protein ACH0B6_15860 [Solibacillus silvestris]
MLNEWHAEVEEVYDQMVAWRRHLHENPELPFQEVQTARMVGDILAGYRIKVQRNIGGHGHYNERHWFYIFYCGMHFFRGIRQW